MRGRDFAPRSNGPPPKSSNVSPRSRAIRPRSVAAVVWSPMGTRQRTSGRGDGAARVDSFEFTPPDIDRVSGYLHHLTEAGEGWINLLPASTPMKKSARPCRPGCSACSATASLPSPCHARAAPAGQTGHRGSDRRPAAPTGAKAAARLGEAGVDIPPTGGCARTTPAVAGLLASLGAPDADIIGWAIRAGTALCRIEMTGQWRRWSTSRRDRPAAAFFARGAATVGLRPRRIGPGTVRDAPQILDHARDGARSR